ncbi:acyl-CoA dehydrogenase family protein [Caldimonas thermodepolymerans]|jgi:Acyl-CoA dehydrogenases|uniref:Acyl-CoA dehydrogenase n=1 Tax=Caldimonas thermodepolymerans TaxID=215580 RepID=A0A2S5T597_9BURK|nr:acyl-CoA dehydrogenase family protein [Caldimonas thermodepolymerans]PPE70170.1 acyl-CoA dehydrogenase [Caldimonas thermodepolymerans]QPC32164.1 acyl-CoA dehydrogenase family protein [Caldimonas thermodepolymerans]RDH98050.1 acyl-CoA dehydrogenase [Caldimonas thermodepolymerans]UZG44966.1 acyl-CoA dehydrogenase family protein [Caldimonas thermodepolymerans]
MTDNLLLSAARNSNYYTPEHEQFRDTVRDFVAREITPHVNAWDEAGEFPRELYRKAAEVGLLGVGYPEEYGGTPADVFYQLIIPEEVARAGCGGVSASLFSHTIGTPPILHAGSDELKARVLPDILAGRKISALCITEPGGGSDVASLRTTAVRDGDHYVVNGEKTFITSGMRADWFTVAVRTNPEVKGAGGVSLLLIPGDTPGITRTKLDKMGWWASDTAHLRFENVRVPVGHLLGVENEGFRIIMRNFNSERLFMAAGAYGFAKVCFADALDWARERKTFGLPLVERQVIRHKLVDMAMKIESVRCMIEDLAWRVQQKFGDPRLLVAQTAMLKNLAMQTMQFCADEAVQILGGMGFMRGTRPERIYREVKVNMIGGGSVEIMKDLAAKQLQL